MVTIGRRVRTHMTLWGHCWAISGGPTIVAVHFPHISLCRATIGLLVAMHFPRISPRSGHRWADGGEQLGAIHFPRIFDHWATTVQQMVAR